VLSVLLATTRSGLPSPSISPMATPSGKLPVAKSTSPAKEMVTSGGGGVEIDGNGTRVGVGCRHIGFPIPVEVGDDHFEWGAAGGRHYGGLVGKCDMTEGAAVGIDGKELLPWQATITSGLPSPLRSAMEAPRT
jgi:hypothetical protein